MTVGFVGKVVREDLSEEGIFKLKPEDEEGAGEAKS